MRLFLEEAVRQFDWVVVDTPPVGLLTDANLLAAMIDLALVVVSAKSTPYPIVRKSIEALGPERVIGVVLNRADTKEATPGYYGYGYSYAYSYANAPRSTGMGRWIPFFRRHRRHA
jgi:tyrosine-protein kinase Etk/Wzc